MFKFFKTAVSISVKRPFSSLRVIASISPILQQKFTQPMITKRYINNNQVLKDLLENPGKTLGEIYRAREGADQYITVEKYNTLSEEDRKSLDDILFTYTGFYALDREFITVDQFLKLPVDARRLFDRLFCEAEERYWSAQRYRDNIDLIFEGEYLDLEKFAAMPHSQRKTLIKLLTNRTSYGVVGISMMQEGCFTINDFIAYAPEQQQLMLELLASVGKSGGWSTMEHRQLREKVKALADVFKPKLTHQEKIVNIFMDIEKYRSLSASDKKSLDTILFTTTGYYALDEGYITVNQFLELSPEKRNLFTKLFLNIQDTERNPGYYEMHIQRHIDAIFEYGYFNFEQVTALPYNQCKALMQLFTLRNNYGCIGLVVIQRECFTVDDYLSFTAQQKNVIIQLLTSIGKDTYWSGSELHLMIEKTKKIADTFKVENLSCKSHPEPLSNYKK